MKKIVVLIDAENTSHAISGAIKFIETRGKIIINNAYADISVLNTLDWKELSKQYKIKPITSYVHNKKSNYSDIKLTIDAMNILHEKEFDTLVLLSSDSDFTALLQEYTSCGKELIGICRKDANEYYKNLFDELFYIDELNQQYINNDSNEIVSNESSDITLVKEDISSPSIEILNDILLTIVPKDGMDTKEVYQKLEEIYPKIRAKDYGENSFWKVLAKCSYFKVTEVKVNRSKKRILKRVEDV